MDTTANPVETPGKDSADAREAPHPPYRKPQLRPYGQLRPNLQLGTPPPPPP